MPEVEEEEPERQGPSLKSNFELKIGFSKRSTFAAMKEDLHYWLHIYV